MKPQILRSVAIALALAASAVFTGCGSNNGAVAPGVPVPVAAMGGVYSTVGGACVPITMPVIGFTVNGMSGQVADPQGDVQFTFGTIPGGMAIGSGGLYAGPPPNSVSSQTFTSSGISGTFAMQATNTGATTGTYGYPYSNYSGTSLMAAGELSISSILQTQIADYVAMTGMSTTMTTMPFPTYGGYANSPYSGLPGYNYSGSYNPASNCISGLAVQGLLYTSVAGARAEVYLYLNNTQHGYVLEFY